VSLCCQGWISRVLLWPEEMTVCMALRRKEPARSCAMLPWYPCQGVTTLRRGIASISSFLTYDGSSQRSSGSSNAPGRLRKPVQGWLCSLQGHYLPQSGRLGVVRVNERSGSYSRAPGSQASQHCSTHPEPSGVNTLPDLDIISIASVVCVQYSKAHLGPAHGPTRHRRRKT
jgi:hypothetical protein